MYIVLVVLSLLKPILNFDTIYDKHHRQNNDHNTNMALLLDQVSDESISNDSNLENI